MGLRVLGSEFVVEGIGIRVQGSGFGVQGSGGNEVASSSSRFEAPGLGMRWVHTPPNLEP